ncbi:MAG: hypothetical protein E7168_02220 [Firmicutes bacterium]|nr:hypothetical protein [Bacillota bacterium]
MHIMEYICDHSFSVLYKEEGLDVLNYTKINYMEETKISLSYSNGNIIIKGDNLRIQKLLDDELFIVGKIENLEFKGL